MVSLELKDIQGNILRGYGFPRAAYLFFMVPDAGSGRRFLGELVDEVQSAEPWAAPPVTATNVAVTYAGRQALCVPDGVLAELPAAFREPIRHRAPRVLGDAGPSAPEHWVEGLGTERSHILVTVNGAKAPDQAFTDATDRIRHRAQAHGVLLVHEQEAVALDKRREHFGWADGFGQPAVEGTPWPAKPGEGVPEKNGTWRSLKAGEFLHGYPDEDEQTVSGPSAPLLRNGTYMVYRKLYQDAMQRQLASAEGCFDFMVQLQGDPRKMPVEDPTVVWRERASPFQKVATIRVPPQVFTSQAQRDFAENLSFTPWHSLPEHRSLGGINRVRKAVYELISKLRHEKNGVPRREPTESELPAGR